MIKTWVTKHYPLGWPQASFSRRLKTTVWQARYWEHLIRNEEDYRQHVEYIHDNPVKHGHVAHPWDWPHSSFQQYVDVGLYHKAWGDTAPLLDEKIGHE